MPAKIESSAPHLEDPANYPGPFKNWGVVSTMIEGGIAYQRHRHPQGA